MSLWRQLSPHFPNVAKSRAAGVVYALLALFFVFSAFLLVRMPDSVKGYIYGLFREIARSQMLLRTHGWEQIQDDIFIVRYRGDENGARLVQETGLIFYQQVYRDFSYLPDLKISRIPVVVYSSREELNASFGWPASESAMGVYWGGVIRVLAPEAWISEDNPEAVRRIFQQAGPMAHELTHLMLDYAAKGNYPRWFTEGVAQYVEYKFTGYIFGQREGIWNRGLYPLSNMDRQFDKLSDQALAYRQSLSVVEYIVAVYGEEELHNIIKNLAAGTNFNKAFDSALGRDVETFEKEWREWLAGELQQPLLTKREDLL